MEITFTLTPEQQAADDARRQQWECDQRQRVRTMPAAEFEALVKQVTKPPRPRPIEPGPHASTLDDAAYARELRRLGARNTIRR
jgi:hypothetical protein